MIGILNIENYFLCSVPVCNYFANMPVPKVPDALDDCRWDLLMHGTSPENLVVRNCHDLSNCIPMMPDPVEQRRLQRLPRNLQNFLVKFQPGRPELWIEAAEQTRRWLDDDPKSKFL